MYVINLAASDLAFSLINGFPLMTVACFNKRWFWGNTGRLRHAPDSEMILYLIVAFKTEILNNKVKYNIK